MCDCQTGKSVNISFFVGTLMDMLLFMDIVQPRVVVVFKIQY